MMYSASVLIITYRVTISPTLLQRYNRPVPRYTSYPPANRFSEDFDLDSLLAAERDPAESCFYFHLPFCPSQCWYCGCTNLISRNPALISRYVDTLCEELRLYAQLYDPSEPVVHLQWGGGSPTALSPANIRQLGQTIRENFPVSDRLDFSIEMDPRHLTADRAAAFAEIGCTRASLGVQDLNLVVQAAINRIQPSATVDDACRRLRAVGIERISLDLVYGLPLQNRSSFCETLEKVLRWQPDRLSLFAYAHIPWLKPEQKRFDRQDSLPDPELRLNLFTDAVSFMEEKGYVWLGLDHFALPDDPLAQAWRKGRLRRNFQGYTTGEESRVVGFGLSSITSQKRGFRQNSKNLRSYLRGISDHRFPVERGYILTEEDRIRGTLIERLMTRLEVTESDLDPWPGTSLSGILQEQLPMIETMQGDGLLEKEEDRLTVTRLGRFFLRCIAQCLDAARVPAESSSAPRHSQSV